MAAVTASRLSTPPDSGATRVTSSSLFRAIGSDARHTRFFHLGEGYFRTPPDERRRQRHGFTGTRCGALGQFGAWLTAGYLRHVWARSTASLVDNHMAPLSLHASCDRDNCCLLLLHLREVRERRRSAEGSKDRLLLHYDVRATARVSAA